MGTSLGMEVVSVVVVVAAVVASVVAKLRTIVVWCRTIVVGAVECTVPSHRERLEAWRPRRSDRRHRRELLSLLAETVISLLLSLHRMEPWRSASRLMMMDDDRYQTLSLWL